MYDEHLKSKKHLRRKLCKESESVWYCEACKIKLPNDNEWVKIAILYVLGGVDDEFQFENWKDPFSNK